MTRIREQAMSRSLTRHSLLALLLAFAVIVVSGAAQSARAAELLMFELQGCPWCKLWHKEIGPAYANTPEGQRAPLRIVDVKGPVPDGIALAKPVRSAPTFVLVENGREIGRITGYPGADFFWPLLDQLLAKLETPVTGRPAASGQRSL
jgi:hypothetical protein